MGAAAFTAAVYLAAIAGTLTTRYESDPDRMALIAVAAEQAQAELLEGWAYPPRELAGAVLTAIIHESGAARGVHDGSIVSKTNDVCIMQINPRNWNWKDYVDEHGELAGLDLESTRNCISVGIATMIKGSNYCRRRRYYTNWRQAMWTMYAFGSKCWLSSSAYERASLQSRIASTDWQPTEEHHRLVAAAEVGQ